MRVLVVEDEMKVANRQPRRFRDATATHQCPDARQQLGEGKRLDQIVIGTGVETGHAILKRVPCGEHEDRRLDTALAQRLQDLQAVASGQRQVEQDDVERLGVDPEERPLAGPLDDDLELLALEPLAQGVGDLHFVFDDENSHQRRV